MKKIYTKFLLAGILLSLCCNNARAQCNVAPPVISGNTLICGTGGVFTFTASSTSPITTWYSSAAGNPAVSSSSVFTTPNLTSSTNYLASVQSAPVTSSLNLPPQSSTNPANTRGYFFISPANFTITGVRVPTDASSANSNIAIINLASTPPLFPSITNAFTVLYLGQNIAGTAIIPVNIPITIGTTVGVLGDRGGNSSYGTGPYLANFLGSTVSLERMGMQFNLSSTAPQDLWTESGGFISRVELYVIGSCTSSMVPVTANVIALPPVSISGPATPICFGSPATTLTANGASSYTWSASSATTTTISVSPNLTTNYTLTGANSFGCANTSSYQLTVTPLPIVNIVATPSIVCAGKSGTLTLSGASNYLWSTGFNSNPLQITPSATTTYSATGTDAFGCVGTAALTVSVSPLPVVTVSPNNSLVCTGQAVNLNVTGAATYSWNTGATTQNITVTPTALTNYTATGFNAAGCSKSVVATLLVTLCTGINENNTGNAISVFPNPANNFITIRSDRAVKEIIIKDVIGNVFSTQKIEGLNTFNLNISELSPGVYFLNIVQDHQEKIVRIVKE